MKVHAQFLQVIEIMLDAIQEQHQSSPEFPRRRRGHEETTSIEYVHVVHIPNKPEDSPRAEVL